MKTSVFSTLALSFVLAAPAMGQDITAEKTSAIGTEREFKGYPKRDRLNAQGQNNVSPSQLHEVYGGFAEGGFLYNSASTENTDATSELTAPELLVRGIYGGDWLTIGLGAGYKSIGFDSEFEGQIFEVESTSDVFTLTPQAALTIRDNVTIGLSADWINVDSEAKEASSNEVLSESKYDIVVPTVGLSYHNPKAEIGLAYSGEVTEDFDRENQNNEVEEDRVYIPAVATVFARGNLTDHVSLFGSVSYTEFNTSKLNEESSVTSLVDKWKIENHLSSKLQGVYWFANRSKLSLTALYTASTATGLGSNNLLNTDSEEGPSTYGAELDYTHKLNETTNIGVLGGFTRGERDETVAGNRYNSAVENFRVGTSLNIRI